MDTGHWIAIGAIATPIVGTGVVKILRLFGRVTAIEKRCESRCIVTEETRDKVDVALHALRELLVHMGIREPGEGINGEDL